jgi:hypothetical protein
MTVTPRLGPAQYLTHTQQADRVAGIFSNQFKIKRSINTLPAPLFAAAVLACCVTAGILRLLHLQSSSTIPPPPPLAGRRRRRSAGSSPRAADLPFGSLEPTRRGQHEAHGRRQRQGRRRVSLSAAAQVPGVPPCPRRRRGRVLRRQATRTRRARYPCLPARLRSSCSFYLSRNQTILSLTNSIKKY